MTKTATEIMHELLEKEPSMFPNSRIAAKAIAQAIDREYINEWHDVFKWRYRICQNRLCVRIYDKTKGNRFLCKINEQEWIAVKKIINNSLEYLIDIEALWMVQLCDDIDDIFKKFNNSCDNTNIK